MLKTYFLFTLGCQMNLSDSEKIEAVLKKFGLRSTNEELADLIIVNACSVRQKPIDRIWGKIKVWDRINPKVKKILTGCVLETDLKKLEKKFDFCFKIENLESLEDYLAPYNLDEKIKTKRDPSSSAQDDNFIAYLPIMTGCNNFCSYCVVPYTRGRERSRRPEVIIKETGCLVKKGFKEIMLLGQNVCSYKNGFVELLKKIVKIHGDFKISFMSPHPKDFSDELIDIIAREDKISKQIHLPLQSGDDEILKRMNRHYTTRQYLRLVDKLRNKVKGVEISTDIIVGFSKEKKKSFQNTVSLVKKCRFNKAYVSIYSERKGTWAEKKMRDNVSLSEKKRRWLILDKLINS